MDGQGIQNAKTDEQVDKYQRALNRKMDALKNIDSVFIRPFGTEGYRMARMIMTADRCITAIKRKAGMQIPITEAREMFADFESFASDMWALVHKYAPNLHHVSAWNWRKVNDEVDTKKVLAHQRATVVIIPRCEESGIIAMATKVIMGINVEMHNRSFDELEQFVADYQRILQHLHEILTVVAPKIGVDYREDSRKTDSAHPSQTSSSVPAAVEV